MEDDELVRAAVLQALREKDYNVLSAENGAEALFLYEEFSGAIHLMAADVITPEMSGAGLLKRLLVSHPDIQIFFMFGYTSNEIVHHGVLDREINFI